MNFPQEIWPILYPLAFLLNHSRQKRSSIFKSLQFSDWKRRNQRRNLDSRKVRKIFAQCQTFAGADWLSAGPTLKWVTVVVNDFGGSVLGEGGNCPVADAVCEEIEKSWGMWVIILKALFRYLENEFILQLLGARFAAVGYMVNFSRLYVQSGHYLKH